VQTVTSAPQLSTGDVDLVPPSASAVVNDDDVEKESVLVSDYVPAGESAERIVSASPGTENSAHGSSSNIPSPVERNQPGSLSYAPTISTTFSDNAEGDREKEIQSFFDVSTRERPPSVDSASLEDRQGISGFGAMMAVSMTDTLPVVSVVSGRQSLPRPVIKKKPAGVDSSKA